MGRESRRNQSAKFARDVGYKKVLLGGHEPPKPAAPLKRVIVSDKAMSAAVILSAFGGRPISK